jgi:hypothetical protein
MKLHALLLSLLLLPLVGCANMSRNSSYAQDKTVTLDEWTQWAEKITTAVVMAPNFAKYTPPVILAIGDFTNNSNRMDVAQDKDVFLGTLQKKLTNSGRVEVTRYLAGNAGRTDTVTKLSGELVDDPTFESGSTDGFNNKAKAPQLVLSMMYNRKRTVDNRGNDVYENYFSIELIDVKRKTAIYADDIYLDKKEGAFRKAGS